MVKIFICSVQSGYPAVSVLAKWRAPSEKETNAVTNALKANNLQSDAAGRSHWSENKKPFQNERVISRMEGFYLEI